MREGGVKDKLPGYGSEMTEMKVVTENEGRGVDLGGRFRESSFSHVTYLQIIKEMLESRDAGLEGRRQIWNGCNFATHLHKDGS